MKLKKLKEKYEDAKLEITEFDAADVVTTSDQSLEPGGNYDDKAWT